MPNLTNINVYNRQNWENINSTNSDDLNFVEAHVIIETYSNGYNWYRLYDDGFIIQGGRINNCVQYNNYTKNLTYLKPFVDTNYTIITDAITDQQSWQIATRIASDITTTQCTIRGGSNNNSAYTGPAMWVAWGWTN